MPGGLPHPPLAVDQTSRLLHTQTPGGQPLLHHGGVQRVSEQEGHLLVLLVGEVVGDGVVLPDNVLDGGLPDGPGPLPVGVVAASCETYETIAAALQGQCQNFLPAFCCI